MKHVILHHSLTADGSSKSFDAIKKYHMAQGWKTIGYQYIIELYGSDFVTFKGRGESEVGAHTEGHNTGTIGICCVGNYDLTIPPDEMLDELYELLDDIAKRYGGVKISGHNEYSSKSCPGKLFPLSEIKELYKTGYRVVQSVKPSFLTVSLSNINYPSYDYKIIDNKIYLGARDFLTQLGYTNITGDMEKLVIKAEKKEVK